MRYPALKLDEMTPRQREVFEKIDQDRALGVCGPYVALMHSPEVAVRVQTLGEHLRVGMRVPERLRVLAMLLAAGRRPSVELKSYTHLVEVRRSGLGDEKIAALISGRRPTEMADDEEMVCEYCSELLNTGRVRNSTYDRVVNHFNREICMELVVICGFTNYLAMLINITKSPFPESIV
jgi:4-carboxymuconolactone decarboxylase